MKITVLIQQVVEIADDDIPDLCAAVNRRFSTPGQDVFPEDLITQAMMDSLIDELPTGWRVDSSEADEMIKADGSGD